MSLSSRGRVRGRSRHRSGDRHTGGIPLRSIGFHIHLRGRGRSRSGASWGRQSHGVVTPRQESSAAKGVGYIMGRGMPTGRHERGHDRGRGSGCSGRGVDGVIVAAAASGGGGALQRGLGHPPPGTSRTAPTGALAGQDALLCPPSFPPPHLPTAARTPLRPPPPASRLSSLDTTGDTSSSAGQAPTCPCTSSPFLPPRARFLASLCLSLPPRHPTLCFRPLYSSCPALPPL